MTNFQKKLKSYVWGYKAAERHWFLKSLTPKLVNPPGMGLAVTIKRAMYAAFEGDIPEGVDLRASCGVDQCVAPAHQKFVPSRAGHARALHLPDLDGVGLDERPRRLPSGLTLALIEQVKVLGREGSSLSSICAATQLDRSAVMKIRGGVYDLAVSALRRSVAARRLRSDRRAHQDIPIIQEVEDRGVAPVEPFDEVDVDDAETVAWLRTMQ